MTASLWGPLAVWLSINAVAVPLTWRLIWPTYKRYGKVLFSLGVSAILAWAFAWWSLLFIVLYPLVGVIGHVWWCRKHDLPVWRPDPEQYRRTQRQWAEKLAKRAQGGR